ncbi:hypothetical protein SBOR_3760 [Sclerotinia borealis F-4128]|uniref:Uncharacterized protein n=1 Tax=Sclerotinia borealis (strain F-4128) TaxID=1432307 RepID=W9CJ49_SCLBF|nr:hypothetical protein SBOR_3760 [Sclerotinia borealis F-4128]
MRSSSITQLSLFAFAALCVAAPTPVTAPMDVAVEYARAAQDSPINLVELSNKKRDGPIDLIQLPEKRQDSSINLVELSNKKRDGPIDLIPLPEKRQDSPIDLIQLPEKRQDSPINLVQLPEKRDGPIDLIQLPKRDGPINLIELSNRQTSKYKTIRTRTARTAQDPPINIAQLPSKRDGPINLIQLDGAEHLETRQNDCGSSPYQNPCSAGTDLNIPAFAAMAMAFAAMGAVMLG